MTEPLNTRASRDRFSAIAGDPDRDRPGTCTFVTSDPDEIRRWADAHQAQPATGEASVSGPSVRNVNDGGAGIRFNFPGWAPFRPISWEEWLDHFRAHDLALVYSEEDRGLVRDRAHERWVSRGQPSGGDWEDWFGAERELEINTTGAPSYRYRLIKRAAASDSGSGQSASQ